MTKTILIQTYLNPTHVTIFLFACIFFRLISNVAETSALDYVNYTSYRYKIQFQYPSNWIQSEKISNHDRGADISVSNGGNGSLFWITRGNDTRIGSDLQAGLRHVMKMLNESNGPNGYEITQPPSFAIIDGKMAEAFTTYSRHRFGNDELDTVEQFWLTYVESPDYYLIGFIAPIQSFNNPESIMVRNQFISSIKILVAADLAKSETG